MPPATTVDPIIRTIITDPNGAQALVKKADSLGQELKNNGLTTSQIRALFGEVRQIQAQWSIESQRGQARRRLTLLKPKMRYRARKERGRAVEMLVIVLEAALDTVIAEQDEVKQTAYFQHFVEYFEAILAYHKAYGGS
jgi:CRISPR-associated protein Csm2